MSGPGCRIRTGYQSVLIEPLNELSAEFLLMEERRLYYFSGKRIYRINHHDFHNRLRQWAKEDLIDAGPVVFNGPRSRVDVGALKIVNPESGGGCMVVRRSSFELYDAFHDGDEVTRRHARVVLGCWFDEAEPDRCDVPPE